MSVVTSRGWATSAVLRVSLANYVARKLKDVTDAAPEGDLDAIQTAIASGFTQLDDEIFSDALAALRDPVSHAEAMCRIASASSTISRPFFLHTAPTVWMTPSFKVGYEKNRQYPWRRRVFARHGFFPSYTPFIKMPITPINLKALGGEKPDTFIIKREYRADRTALINRYNREVNLPSIERSPEAQNEVACINLSNNLSL